VATAAGRSSSLVVAYAPATPDERTRASATVDPGP
jgi:hypothetical protein